jgi:hypothetical protein
MPNAYACGKLRFVTAEMTAVVPRYYSICSDYWIIAHQKDPESA